LTEKKKGWRQRLSEVLWKEKKPTYLKQKMEGMGVSILSDQKLEDRLKKLQILQEAIMEPIEAEDDEEKYITALQERLDVLNQIIYHIAAPFARSGDFPKFSKMLHGWSRLYASSSSWLLRTQDYYIRKANGEEEDSISVSLGFGSVNIKMMIRFLHDVLQKHIIKDGFLILGKCFMDRDVSERAAIVVQNVQQTPRFIPYGSEQPRKETD